MKDKHTEAAFDVRIIERNIAAGRVEQAEYDARLGEIEDCGEEADWTTTRMSMPPKAEDEEAAES